MENKDYSQFCISTERLILKAISVEYAEEIFHEFNANITTYMHPRPANELAETEAFIEMSLEKMQRGEDIQTVILDKTNGHFFGCAGLHKSCTDTPELGIWLKKSAHGKAYGMEAIYALKNWADQNLSYKHLLYPVDQDNYASRRIPESLNAEAARKYQAENMSGRMLNIIEFWIYPF